MKTLYEHIKIPALKGTETIAAAKGFAWIDTDLKNYGTDKKGIKTKALELAVLEIEENGTFKDIFSKFDLNNAILSQEQILCFLENNKDKLRTGGWANLFLFKVKDERFVAYVYFNDDGTLRVVVCRFSNGRVWSAEFRPRVVVPQLALKSSEIYLDSFDPLSLEKRMHKLEDFKKKVEKIINL